MFSCCIPWCLYLWGQLCSTAPESWPALCSTPQATPKEGSSPSPSDRAQYKVIVRKPHLGVHRLFIGEQNCKNALSKPPPEMGFSFLLNVASWKIQSLHSFISWVLAITQSIPARLVHFQVWSLNYKWLKINNCAQEICSFQAVEHGTSLISCIQNHNFGQNRHWSKHKNPSLN